MRKPGGQQGNQNARIHGYYSKVLDEDELKYYRQASKFVGLDAEITLLRVKLKSLIDHDPQNLKLISQAANSLARMVLTQYSINKPDKEILKEQIKQQRLEWARQNVIDTIGKDLGFPWPVDKQFSSSP
jgi:hypothetical protein